MSKKMTALFSLHKKTKLSVSPENSTLSPLFTASCKREQHQCILWHHKEPVLKCVQEWTFLTVCCQDAKGLCGFRRLRWTHAEIMKTHQQSEGSFSCLCDITALTSVSTEAAGSLVLVFHPAALQPRQCQQAGRQDFLKPSQKHNN